jgi:hypothetical protein
MITSLRTLMEEKDKKHELEIRTLKEQMNLTKQTYEKDLLNDEKRTKHTIQQNYVKFEQQETNPRSVIHNNRIMSHSIPPLDSPSLSTSSESSLFESNSSSSSSSSSSNSLDDEITKLQSQIMQRLSIM